MKVKPIDPDALTLGELAVLEELTGMSLVEVLAALQAGDPRKWSSKLMVAYVMLSTGATVEDAAALKLSDLDFEELLPTVAE